MDELLEQLRWLLNLPVGATAEETVAQLQKLIDQIKTDPAQAAASFDLAAFITTQGSEIATLKAISAAAPDPAKYAEVATMKAISDELAALKAKTHGAGVEKVVTDALASGKLLPAQEAWARDLGGKDLAALTAFVATAVAPVTLGGTQTNGKAPDGTDLAVLTADQVALCRQMGVTVDDFRKTLAAETQAS